MCYWTVMSFLRIIDLQKSLQVELKSNLNSIL